MLAQVAKNILVRPLSTDDSSALVELERVCSEAAQWGEQGYQGIGQSGVQGWAAERAGHVVGFVLIRVVSDEMEILNLAVEPAARRKGIASSLLSNAIKRGRELAAKRAYLEFRESNSAAKVFYARHGFRETARRETYYSQPAEDAIILVRELH
jgi:ribosomal-protein-alanine acetyltransferase